MGPRLSSCLHQLIQKGITMSRTQITVNPNHPHGNMPGWEAEGVDLETMLLIKRMVLANHMDSPDYKAKQGSGVFLQGYQEPDDHSKGWIFLEFWQPNYQRFVDHVNAELLKEENYAMIRQIYPERF
jgi:hypothetical protein